MKRLATLALIAGLSATFAFGAQAQDAPKRCGGLLCDMGMFGGSSGAASALPCNDFLCRAFGGRQAEAAPPPPPEAAVAAPPEPAPMKHHKKKRMAKAAMAKAAMAPADASAPAAAK